MSGRQRKEPRILFLKKKDEVVDYLLSDLQDCGDVRLLTVKKTGIAKLFLGRRSPLSKILKKTGLYDYFINKKNVYNIGRYINRSTCGAILIIQAQLLNRIEYKYWENLKKSYGCALCLWIIDSVHASSPTFHSAIQAVFSCKWDKIYTYDEYDAREFGWESINRAYFSASRYPKYNESGQKPEYDVYFTGGLKGNREELIFRSFETFKKNALTPLYSLFCFDKAQYEKYAPEHKGINFFTKWRSYEQIIRETMNSRCIVEILQEGQKSQSVRYFEALYFNKRLLTNNAEITSLPYYRPEYMKFFSTVEDIDLEWLKKDIKVDYGYRNDFTPLKFIEQVLGDIPEHQTAAPGSADN